MVDKDVTDEEIFEAERQINPLKTLCPDGMQVIFYQKNWDIIGKFVYDMVWSFFNSFHMLKELQRTYITLIPQIVNPENINRYRPISLCNISYKIMSKYWQINLKSSS